MVKENFECENVVIDDLEAVQTVYIFNCKKSTIHLRGKANAIYMGITEFALFLVPNY